MEDTTNYPQGEHVHDYFGRTSVDMGHFHTFTGSTMVQQPAVGGHVHNYANETRVAENHTHIMRGTTGVPIPVLLGHVHQLAGITEVADNHTHSYDVYSGYQRSPRNLHRPRAAQLEATAEKEEAPTRGRLRFRLPIREARTPKAPSDEK